MQIIKTGTIDANIVEANPIVFQDKLYIMEYIRSSDAFCSTGYYGAKGEKSHFRFLDVAENEYTVTFGHGLHMGNAFVNDGKVYVTAVENWGKGRFYIMESDDLLHWSNPRVILENPCWAGYNTSCCKAGDRFVLAFELGKPKELVGVPFTMFFAESKDMKTFHVLPEAIFGKDFYTGAPMLRYYGVYFYFFYLDGGYDTGFTTRVARSSDLQYWDISRKTVLGYDDVDRSIADKAVNPEIWGRQAATAVNINASDLDMTEFNGNLEFVYSWGNQRGVEFLARGIIKNTDEETFCKSFFE